MNPKIGAIVIVTIANFGTLPDAAAAGDAARGAEQFRQCAACHSINPGEHLTGPSLAGVVGRRAGTAKGFGRYSQAMRDAHLTWSRENLDEWLKSPSEFLPGTSMRIPGVGDADARVDIIAYLESAGAPASAASSDSADGGAGMTVGTGSQRLENLKMQSPSRQVVKIRHCGDAYEVTLGTGDTYTFWEFNLRFKTDSGPNGPPDGKPAILRGGMMGDRAFVIFAGPEEISAFIDSRC